MISLAYLPRCNQYSASLDVSNPNSHILVAQGYSSLVLICFFKNRWVFWVGLQIGFRAWHIVGQHSVSGPGHYLLLSI